jgi:hypothetical protein
MPKDECRRRKLYNFAPRQESEKLLLKSHDLNMLTVECC